MGRRRRHEHYFTYSVVRAVSDGPDALEQLKALARTQVRGFDWGVRGTVVHAEHITERPASATLVAEAFGKLGWSVTTIRRKMRRWHKDRAPVKTRRKRGNYVPKHPIGGIGR